VLFNNELEKYWYNNVTKLPMIGLSSKRADDKINHSFQQSKKSAENEKNRYGTMPNLFLHIY